MSLSPFEGPPCVWQALLSPVSQEATYGFGEALQPLSCAPSTLPSALGLLQINEWNGCTSSSLHHNHADTDQGSTHYILYLISPVKALCSVGTFVVVQSLNRVWLFVPPGPVAHQASLPFTISQSLLRLMSMESVMLTKHLILCCLPLLFVESQNSFLAWPLLTSAVILSPTPTVAVMKVTDPGHRGVLGGGCTPTLSVWACGASCLFARQQSTQVVCTGRVYRSFTVCSPWGAGQSPLSPQLAGDCIHFYC